MHVKMSFIFPAMKIAEMESLEGPRACLSDFFFENAKYHFGRYSIHSISKRSNDLCCRKQSKCKKDRYHVYTGARALHPRRRTIMDFCEITTLAMEVRERERERDESKAVPSPFPLRLSAETI